MTDGLIGVIVPVYKVEKYVAECIESILVQTYTKFRLILVDDGTPDNAGKICDEYAQKDPRITVIHQENAGVTRARARGVEEAKDCEFITFVDGDDTLLIDSIQSLCNLMDSNVDIVIGEYQDISDRINTQILNKCVYISKLIHSGLPQAPWGKLIRKTLFTDKTFDIPRNITVGEDAIMNIRLAARTTKKIILTNKKIYNYRILPNSTFHSFKNSLAYQAEYFEILEQSIPKELYNELLPYVILRALDHWKIYYRYTSKKAKKEDRIFIKKIKRYIKEANFKIDCFDKIQLYCPIRLFRFIAVNVHKFKNKIS